jgi:hypothetical protein
VLSREGPNDKSRSLGEVGTDSLRDGIQAGTFWLGLDYDGEIMGVGPETEQARTTICVVASRATCLRGRKSSKERSRARLRPEIRIGPWGDADGASGVGRAWGPGEFCRLPGRTFGDKGPKPKRIIVVEPSLP